MTGSILVTGASGFLGRHLMAALREHGENVAAHTSADGDIARDPIRAEDVRHVYHLAARTYVPDSWTDPRGFYEVNVLGTVNVLDFCRRQGASLTLLSSYVYGRPDRLPITEDHPVRAFNPYSHSKILAEQTAAFYRDAFNVPVAVIRPFNLYGPWQPKHFLIPTLLMQALSPECNAITVADDRPKRDYIFVDDVVSLLLRQLDQAHAGGVYNAGSGTSISVGELGRMVAQVAGTNKPLVSRGEHRQDEVLDTVADITRARGELGWRPVIGLEEGLRRTMQWLTGAAQ